MLCSDPVHPTESSGHALAEQIPPAEQLSSLQSGETEGFPTGQAVGQRSSWAAPLASGAGGGVVVFYALNLNMYPFLARLAAGDAAE